MTWRRRDPARGRSWTWFVAFQAAALVPVLLVGLSLSSQYERQRTNETLRDARSQALDVADLAVGPALPAGDLSTVTPQAAQAAVEGVLRRPAVRDQVLRLKVWDRTGRIVASDSPELVGRSFPLEDDVREALEGEPAEEVTHLDGPENVEEHDLGTAVEAYVPLHGADPDTVVGVLEVYLPYEPLAADLRQGERTLLTHLAVGLAGVVVALGLLTTAMTARLRRRTLRAQHLADHDGLTGLLSRSAFEDRLGQLVEGGVPAVVVLGDLDDFKRVNDALGHIGGDALLCHAARVLTAAAPGGSVARLGGDEFAVLLPGVCSALDAEAALTALHTSGTALYDPLHEPFEAAQLQLLADLRRAVEAGQLVLHYQPQARAEDGQVVAVEALVRWQHPGRGLLAPDEFLPLAERTGLVVQITRWVLDTAAGQLADWVRQGLDLTCSVNISARDLADPGLVSNALAAARRHGVPPYRLCLELTETAIMEDARRAREVLTAVSAAGFAISLDDFGQGYTSLGQLRDLPLDELKLDRSFVSGMADHSADRAVVATVVQLAHSLRLRVVAEGVETAEQAAALREQGYDVVQGWHVGRPALPEQLGALLRASAGATA